MFSVFSTNYAYCDIQVNKQNSSSAMLQAKSLFHTPLNTEDTIISSYPLQLSSPVIPEQVSTDLWSPLW